MGRAAADRVSLDPWGHLAAEKTSRARSLRVIDIRPSIAITRARLDFHARTDKPRSKPDGLKQDGEVVHKNGSVFRGQDCGSIRSGICRAWPQRFATTREPICAGNLFEQTAGMYPELVTPARSAGLSCRRSAVHSLSVRAMSANCRTTCTRITCRVHDECNGLRRVWF
jgi:hypothetical protein